MTVVEHGEIKICKVQGECPQWQKRHDSKHKRDKC